MSFHLVKQFVDSYPGKPSKVIDKDDHNLPKLLNKPGIGKFIVGQGKYFGLQILFKGGIYGSKNPETKRCYGIRFTMTLSLRCGSKRN